MRESDILGKIVLVSGHWANDKREQIAEGPNDNLREEDYSTTRHKLRHQELKVEINDTGLFDSVPPFVKTFVVD